MNAQYLTVLIKIEQKGLPLHPPQSDVLEGEVLVIDGEPVMTPEGMIPVLTEQGRALITREQFDAAAIVPFPFDEYNGENNVTTHAR